jgi:hypothetical protein
MNKTEEAVLLDLYICSTIWAIYVYFIRSQDENRIYWFSI